MHAPAHIRIAEELLRDKTRRTPLYGGTYLFFSWE